MDHRRDPRFTLLIRTAKLVAPTGEFMCILRDASASGIRVQIFHPLPEGRNFILELPNGDRHRIETVWEEQGHAGFRFMDRVDLARLIGDPGPFPKRPVRLAVQLPALISSQGITTGIVIRNLSQTGARIECQSHLAIGQKLRLEADPLPVLEARVRWRRGTDYGVALDQTFRFEELAKLVAVLQQSSEDGSKGLHRFEGVRFA
ncbi:hypothetical protein MB02_08800 [Croceicoccus estronivorus]|nr:hypothetical protein MB02_08800 [Croceicoccus estronivorus]